MGALLAQAHLFVTPEIACRPGLDGFTANLGDHGLAAFRAASAMPISVAPPNNRLMPTRRPIAHYAEPGRPAMMKKAMRMSIRHATSSQDQRPDSSRRCSSEYMMVATPSARK